MNAATLILRTFAAANANVGNWDTYGMGWNNTLKGEAEARAALMAFGHDAWSANILMEEALMPQAGVRDVANIYVGSHRAPVVLSGWQQGFSTEADKKYRAQANARYAS